jgi:general stress protein CsbA
MNPVSNSTRILHFAGGLCYLFFFLGFYTLPAINLHAIEDIKSFIAAFVFPMVLLVILFARLFMRRYPTSLLMIFVSKNDEEYEEEGRKIFWLFNGIAFLLPPTLISFDLHKNDLHPEGYFKSLWIACIIAASLGFILGQFIVFRAEKKNKLINKLILGTLLGALLAAVAWWAVCEIRVLYEMIFLHPEVFRI